MVAKSQPTDASDREPLSGLVVRVTFHSSETGFCVLRVKVRGHRDLVTVLGSAADIHSGEYVQASGRWERHRDHGMQFRALFLQVTAPTSLEGIERYLGSGMIKGIALSDFIFVEAADPEDAVAKVVKVVSERIPARFGFNAIRDVQVLCPMNRGGVGARSLNLDLQTALNPQRQDQPVVERFGFTYRVGDKVMQIQNDYEKDAFNGDIGFVAAIDTDEGEVLIDFDGRQIVYEFGELDEVVLAYATTIHKSQGSEYPAVVIPVLTQHYPMLQRNLLYTGITRGARLVVLIGQKKAVGIAVRGQRERTRWSKLRELLAGKVAAQA